MHSIFRSNFIRRSVSPNRFQCHLRLQFCAVSLALSCHRFPPCCASLDTAILSYLPVQETGTIIEILRNIPISLPPPSEQEAITIFLNCETVKINTLIAKKERLIELLREKRAALISHAVTKGLDPTVPMKDSGVEWLGEIPAHWEVLPLKRLAKIRYGL